MTDVDFTLVFLFAAIAFVLFQVTKCDEHRTKQTKEFLTVCVQSKPTEECIELSRRLN